MEKHAISEVAGTMILIGVVVLGMIIVNLVVFSTPTNNRIPSLEASMANRSTLITIVHQGGDSIPFGEFKILVDGVDRTGDFANSGTYPWSVGETLSYNGTTLPQSAIMIYNGTGTGGTIILQTRFPWGVYVGGTAGSSGGSGGSTTTTTAAPGSYPWYDCAWGYRKNITINHNQVSGIQTSFPVLISLSSDSDLSARVQADGDDILFTAADGTTKLSHEIESYTGGTLVAWVKVPAINSVTDTTIIMYYGNSGASSQQDAANVWDSNFKAVWHHDHDFLDSTANNNDGTNSGSVNEAAKIARAQHYDGANDYVQAPDYDILNAITISAWIYRDTVSTYDGIISKRIPAENAGDWVIRGDTSTGGKLQWILWSGTDTSEDFATASTVGTGAWTHVVMTFDDSANTAKFYLNGNIDKTDTTSFTTSTLTGNSEPIIIGYDGQADTTGYFDGLIDEIRISNTIRSPEWIATEYANQNSPGTFSSVGSQVTVPASCGGITPTPTPTMPWYDCNWDFRKNITIDHNQVSGTQTSFPVLVSLSSDGDLSANARSDGYDILFTREDGLTKIPHEIESYSSGTLIAWVKVPSINSATDTTIMMYYGNSGASDQQDAANVWDSNYKGVWHLEEAVTDESTSGTHKDSTSNGYDGAQNNNGPVTGKIGGAQYFDGTGDYITMTSHPAASSQITMEAWVYLPTPTTNQKIMGDLNRPSGTFYGYLMGVNNNGGNGGVYPEIYDTSATDNTFIQGTIPANTWTHLVVNWTTNGYYAAYINGNRVYSTTAGSNNIGDAAGPMRIGAAPWDPTSFPLTGRIDEVRISSTSRSPGWIATEYANMNSPSTFVTAGSQVTSPCGGAPPAAPAGWYDCNWDYRKNITINHANIVGTQTDFPVLVSLTSDSDLSLRAQSDGDDILFTASDGMTKLSHEIESYSGGTLVAWVKVPSINPVTDTTIMMYYGNSGTSSQEEAANVWDSGFKGVWHLGTTLDSTANNNDGTNNGASSASGKIGQAYDFEQTESDYIRVTDSSSLDITNAITLSAWIRIESYGQDSFGTILDKYWDTGFDFSVDDETGTTPEDDTLYFESNNVAIQDSANDGILSTGQWYYVAVTYNRSMLRFYVDGADRGGANFANALPTNNLDFLIGSGWHTGPAVYYDFDGLIDEGRVSATARSSNWIATEYNNQNSPSTFISVGSQVASGCTGSTPPPAGWYDCDWGYRKNVTINHLKVPSTLTNFPVLVSLSSDSDLAARAQSDGDDILFTTSDGQTKLPHEIESYTSASGALIAWVKVPSVSSATDTTIMMYYGNGDVSSQQNRNGVWDSSYVGVWHLADTSGATQDSTSYNTGGTVSGSITRGATGKIGKAFDVYTNGEVDWGDPADGHLDFGTGSMTADLWINIDAPVGSGAWPEVLWKGNDEYGTGYWVEYDDDNNRIYFGMNDGSSQWGWSPDTSYSDDTWYHIVGVIDRPNNLIRLYKNGVQVGTTGISGVGSISDTSPFTIGADGGWGWFDGLIDEVRISSTPRSSGWIAAEYNNTASPSTFYSLGSQVASGCSVTPTPTPPLLGAPWYDCAWQERKQITIDHTRVSGDQADFPVLVSLSSDTGLSGNAQNDGDDILFTSSDGTTKLSHEIESYTGGTGTLAAWVKVPSLSSTTDTVIYMYYGNPSAASQQDADNAWEGNFKAVWHHDHDFLDSTANNNDGTNSGSVNTAAKIGRAQDYDGSDDYVDVGSGSSLDDAFAGGGTISAWIYPQGWGGSGYGRVADKATTAGYHTNGWAFMVDNSAIAEGLRFARGFSTTRGGWDTPDNSIDLNTWQYVVTTYNEDSTSNDPIIYINGVAQTLTEGYTPAGTAQADTASNMRIGNWGGGTNRTFDGILDEIRLSTNVRSAGWIVTEYNNQNDPPGFFTLSVEESAPCTPPPTTVPTTPAATLTPSPPWFDCQWTYRRNITINKAYVSGTQANFPVLVSLSSDAGLRDHARSDGYDIVFTTSDGQTEIPYERESYTSSTGALNAWVKVPSISSAANTTIFMYYGDPSSADRANPTGVWDAGFAAVWHLNEAVTDEASAGLHQDSTSYGNTGFQRNNTRATGKIAGAQSFDGTLDWIQIPSSASMNVTSTMTMEGWVNLPAPGGDQKVFYKADPYTTRYQGYGLGVRTAHINYEFWGVNRVRYYNETAGTVPASTWTHLAVSWGKGERIRAYINGALVNISYNGNTNINSTFYDARIGVSSWDIVQFPVTGLVDEVRLSSTNRSAEWILTGYNNQNAPSSFAVIGSQEGYSCGGGSAPAYVQSRGLSYGSASSAAITLPSATTAGNLLVLSLVFDSQALSVSSVSDSKNGAAYNLVSMTNVGTWGKLYTYYVNNSLGGAGAITSTVTLSGTTPSLLDVFLLEYSGVAAMSPFDQTSAGSAASGTAMYSGAKSITNATELIYGFGADDYSCHASGSYTDRETANGQCAVDQSVTITGSYNVTATQSSSGAWALQMATFRGA